MEMVPGLGAAEGKSVAVVVVVMITEGEAAVELHAEHYEPVTVDQGEPASFVLQLLRNDQEAY